MSVVLLDFDGTLADTFPLVCEGLQRVLPRYGVRVPTPRDIEQLRNKKPYDWFKEYGVSWWKVPFIVHAFRKELRRRKEDIELHHGVAQALHTLKENGHILGIVTSNSLDTVQAVLQKADVLTCIADIQAVRGLFSKHNILRKLKKKHHGDVVYVGDETRDIEAAQKAGIPVVAVSWGYHSKRLLESMRPNAMVHSPHELASVVTCL